MNIILREEWNAREPIAKHNLTERPAPYVVIHHSATRSCFSEAKCKRLVKSFQNFHMDTRKWDDIAYNFVVKNKKIIFMFSDLFFLKFV